MKISVNLYGGLGKYSKEGKRKHNLLKVSGKTGVKDIIDILQIPEEEVRIIMVNGIHESLNYELSENDKLSFFPLIFGG